MYKERLPWIDIMRGFSMVLVVFAHVNLSMGLGGHQSFLGSIFLPFRMPLFFFVSGFLAYKAANMWTVKQIKGTMIRKIEAQIICTIVFVTLYRYVTNTPPLGWLYVGFEGYWFTIVLFQMFSIYLIMVCVSRLFKVDLAIPFLIIVSVVAVYIVETTYLDTWVARFLCWGNLLRYFQFFTLGLVCSGYKNVFFKLLRDQKAFLITLIGWVICMVLWYNERFQFEWPYSYRFVQDILIRYLALFTVISLFYSKAGNLDKRTSVNKVLDLIGKRTLDIYMIHYFFLPDLTCLHDWLSEGNQILIQFVIALTLTVIIVCICLGISSILRHSIYLRSLLFGVKLNIER